MKHFIITLTFLCAIFLATISVEAQDRHHNHNHHNHNAHRQMHHHHNVYYRPVVRWYPTYGVYLNTGRTYYYPTSRSPVQFGLRVSFPQYRYNSYYIWR